MRQVASLIFLPVGLLVVHAKIGLIPARWVTFVVLAGLTLNWWIPRFLTRNRERGGGIYALPIAGGVVVIGGAILLYLNYGFAPAIAVVLVVLWLHLYCPVVCALSVLSLRDEAA